MEIEIARASSQLKISDNAPPYFVAYTLRDQESASLGARYGAIVEDQVNHQRSVFVEVRVGDYLLDNSNKKEEGFFGPSDRSTYRASLDAPLDGDLTALRASLWLATDQQYKRALADFLSKRGDQVYEAKDDRAPSFTREKPAKHVDPALPLAFDRDTWKRELVAASRLFRRSPMIFDNSVRLNANREARSLVNTEGTRIIEEERLYGLHLRAVARAEDGMLLDQERSYYARTEAGLPRGKALLTLVDGMIHDLLALRVAPVMDPATGPALLEPDATGVLFHEAIGHRLEGERQDNEEEGQTFQGQLGRRVIPAFIDVYDDPTLATWEKTPLNGFYRFDDEGVPAQRASLIEAGVLRGYLTSRTPVKGGAKNSNGHGRTQGQRDPIARMANLIVQPAADTKEIPVVSRTELERRLIAVARRQKKAYAFIVADINGGDTNTSGYNYQAFRGRPGILWRIDVATGKREMVRGVELVGTPLTVINKITALTRESGVFNGFCGAESGFVPVSTVAPAVLITELELQRQRKDAERAPVLPPPWLTPKRSKVRPKKK